MTPERWREIERLYYAALDRDAVDRAAFLNDACGSDEALRHEVESLFVYQTKAKDFIEAPAAKVHLELLSRVLTPIRGQHESSASGRFVGRVLGVYEVQTLIGAGGMGEVYRAVDTRLNRTVAIKVLPEHVSNDPARRERFKREAKIISTLNHPHICALYDVGSHDGADYLVMEHIDGETLQHRLDRGALPLPRALEYAIQICDALDKAHRRGVTHRDLKPANVMLTKSGAKLLDFGAATSGAPTDGIASMVPREDGSQGLTAEGMILGTLQYMSPEQLQGKPADGRTDIFAFGAVAYEMITGQKALRAASHAELISAILRDEAQPIADFVPQTPPLLGQAITRCLSKDPDERWQTASDLLFQLRCIASASPTVESQQSPPRKLTFERAAWTAAVLASIVITFVWARSRDARPGDLGPMAAAIRFNLVPAEGHAFYSGYGVPFALSPDGRQIVYVGDNATGMRQLWLRSLSSEHEQPLPGTAGANTPFWSPDNQWIGFFAENTLKKVRISSGLTQVIASNVATFGGATWNADDVIVFATLGGLSRVSAQGGLVSPVTKGEGSHLWPQFLGDGKHFIYAAPVPASLYIGSLGSEAPKTLMKFPVRISSLAYVPGYVFFVQDAALFATAFDEQRLELSGDAIKIADGIPVTGPGRASFSVSGAGVLAYWPYPVGTPAVLRWFERDGRTSPALDAPAQYVGFALSPDGRQLAFSRATRTGGADVWLRDLSRGSESQLTFDGAAFTPQWSPDGTRIVFSGPGQSPPPKLFIRTVAGADAPSRLGDSPTPNFASSWSGDGQSIVSVRMDPVTRNDLWVQPLQDSGGKPLPFNTPFNESNGHVSPDGRWIAYVTDESGREEVWVAGFPSGSIRRQVSVRGGTSAQWSQAGNELYYVSEDKQLMAVRFSGGPSGVELGTPQLLFHINDLAELDRLVFPTANAYSVAAAGQRFLVAVRARDPNAPPISVVVNWRALLKR